MYIYRKPRYTRVLRTTTNVQYPVSTRRTAPKTNTTKVTPFTWDYAWDGSNK